MIRIEVSEDHISKKLCVHVEDYETKVQIDQCGEAHAVHHLSASIYSQVANSNENIARLVLVSRKLQNQLDAIVPGLFNQLPPDDPSSADAMRILSIADEMEAAR